MSGGIFTEAKGLGIQWIYLDDLIVNFDLLVVLSELVVQTPEFM
jgi:hypothetical protein